MSYKYLLKTQTRHNLVPREAATIATKNSRMFCVLQALLEDLNPSQTDVMGDELIMPE